MSNLIKKRKIFSSDSESDGEQELVLSKSSKQTSSSEPAIVKKLKKTSQNVDEFQKKLDVVNQINAVKKDQLTKFLEEEDEKLSPKKKTSSRVLVKGQKSNKVSDDVKEEEDIDAKLEEDDTKKEEVEEDEEDDDNEEEEDSEGDDRQVKSRRNRHQSYDQDSTNDKESSFDAQFSFKDDDDFYIQANKNRQGESQQEKEIIQLVKERHGKIISKSRGYIFTVICFRNHVFDADIENIIKKWCPQCHILHQEYSQYAISQQGELESEFFQPKLNFRCKFYHRWQTPELNCIKQKVWCPKCPEVLNLMINHHHRGIVNDDEKIQQIIEQAELVADGYQVTNLKCEQNFELLKDLYFILLVPLSLYSRYLQSFKVVDQAKEFKKKLALMHPDNNSHPLSEQVTEKLYKMFEHLLESSDDEKSEQKSSQKQ